MRILSLGVGVQSSTTALMCKKGELPMPDTAIFADTQAEPDSKVASVYRQLDFLRSEVGTAFPIYDVTAGNLEQDVLNSIKNQTRSAQPPFFVINREGVQRV